MSEMLFLFCKQLEAKVFCKQNKKILRKSDHSKLQMSFLAAVLDNAERQNLLVATIFYPSMLMPQYINCFKKSKVNNG